MSNQCVAKSTQKVTHIIFEAENLLVVTTDMIKVTGVHFNAATVSESVTDRASDQRTCQVSKPKPNCCADPEANHIEFLKSEGFHHKALKNTVIVSNGKSTTVVISHPNPNKNWRDKIGRAHV